MTDTTSPLSTVDEAVGWAEHLIRRMHRGPGDTLDAAMHRASVKYGVEHQTLWRLRYRRPKDIMASAYRALKAAYEADISSVEAQVASNLEILRTLPATPALERQMARLEEFLRNSESPEIRALAERAETPGQGQGR